MPRRRSNKKASSSSTKRSLSDQRSTSVEHVINCNTVLEPQTKKKKISNFNDNSIFPDDVLDMIFDFLLDSDRKIVEQVSIAFHRACVRTEKRDVIEYWNDENNFMLCPLKETPVPLSVIEQTEIKLQIRIPFHLREFLQITNGRRPFSSDFIHISNVLLPIEQWYKIGGRVVIGGTKHEEKSILMNSRGLLLLETYDSDDSDDDYISGLGTFKQFLKMESLRFDLIHYDTKKLAHKKHFHHMFTPYSSSMFTIENKELIYQAVKQGGNCAYLPESFKSDRSFMLKLVKVDGSAIKAASVELRDDKQIAMAALSNSASSYRYLSFRLKCDEEICQLAFAGDGNMLRHAPFAVKNNRDIMLKAVKSNSKCMFYAVGMLRLDKELLEIAIEKKTFGDIPYNLKRDKDFMLKAISYKLSLKMAAFDLRNDEDVVLAAVLIDPKNLEYASARLQNNRDIVKAAVQSDVTSLKHASTELKNDKEILLIALDKLLENRNGNIITLEFCPFSIRNDRDIALKAVQLTYNNMKFVSSELRKDKSFVMEVLKLPNPPVDYIDDSLFEDEEIITLAMQKYPHLVSLSKSMLRNNRKVALATVNKDGAMLKDLSIELRNDREIVKAAIKQNNQSIFYASYELRNDPEMILFKEKEGGYSSKVECFCDRQHVLNLFDPHSGILQCTEYSLADNEQVVTQCIEHEEDHTFPYLSDRLRDDDKLALSQVTACGSLLEYVSPRLKRDRSIVQAATDQYAVVLQYADPEFWHDKELVLKAVKQDGLMLQYAPYELRNDKAVVIAAVSDDPASLQFASDDLRNDKEIVLKAISQSASAIQFASDELLHNEDIVSEALMKSDSVTALIPESVLSKDRIAELREKARSNDVIVIDDEDDFNDDDDDYDEDEDEMFMFDDDDDDDDDSDEDDDYPLHRIVHNIFHF
ncbi:hypothetical protein C9374_005484 [Naegleria lovaniensis]|uniref:DUF4116 domain-containing protein n=1 Tax=Naegleria lovaniensis TaxID=51637 RepID=A0AA88GQ13_NAELO|nr:uncharacterized protein C9374_005484 [Naegleria lovaniensis]KAG2382282.1 hypothetical protein C9374_005484 [Naegleria lovaniensis]